MESILAVICVISLLAAGTSWIMAYRVTRDWSRFVRQINDDWRCLFEEAIDAVVKSCGNGRNGKDNEHIENAETGDEA